MRTCNICPTKERERENDTQSEKKEKKYNNDKQKNSNNNTKNSKYKRMKWKIRGTVKSDDIFYCLLNWVESTWEIWLCFCCSDSFEIQLSNVVYKANYNTANRERERKRWKIYIQTEKCLPNVLSKLELRNIFFFYSFLFSFVFRYAKLTVHNQIPITKIHREIIKLEYALNI